MAYPVVFSAGKIGKYVQINYHTYVRMYDSALVCTTFNKCIHKCIHPEVYGQICIIQTETCTLKSITNESLLSVCIFEIYQELY